MVTQKLQDLTLLFFGAMVRVPCCKVLHCQRVLIPPKGRQAPGGALHQLVDGLALAHKRPQRRPYIGERSAGGRWVDRGDWVNSWCSRLCGRRDTVLCVLCVLCTCQHKMNGEHEHAFGTTGHTM